MRFYERPMEISAKEDRTPLTEADRASHDLIVAALRELTPDLPVLSEESSATEIAERRSWEKFWLVDPLDGTKEFLKQTGHFTVNIALVDGFEAVLGVVHAPAIQTFYYASRGDGAFRRDPAGTRSIEAQSPDPEVLRIATSVDHLGPRESELIEALGSTSTVQMGSSLKFCLVAEGKADLYPRFVPTMEWDTGAAQVVVEEAGGLVVDETFQPLRYNKASLRNPSLLTLGHEDVKRRVRAVLV